MKQTTYCVNTRTSNINQSKQDKRIPTNKQHIQLNITNKTYSEAMLSSVREVLQGIRCEVADLRSRGNHLPNTTCLPQGFFKSDEYCSKLK